MTIAAVDIKFSISTPAEAGAGLSLLLDSAVHWIRRYVVVTEHQAVAIVLWVAHTHAIEAADCTPYLQVTSATKRSGKTRLLEALEPLVFAPWLTGRTSAAALVRKVDAEQPTLLLDESDAAFGGEKEYAEALRGILNTGYRKSGKATLCVGQGAKFTTKDFTTFCPKAIAGIGTLPDTVADRSIPIQLRRRTQDEPCERWREREGHWQAQPLHERLSAWGAIAVETLRGARPALPQSLGDRQADVWEPLLAIADLAGDSWPMLARQAAIALSGTFEDADMTVEILTDIQIILADYAADDVITSKELVDHLVALDDRPWVTWSHGRPMSANKLARFLAPLGIFPAVRRVGTKVQRSYRIDAFHDAIARYLPIKPLHRNEANDYGAESSFSNRNTEGPCYGSQSVTTPIDSEWSNGVTVEKGDTRDRRDSEPFVFDYDPFGTKGTTRR
jgi:hypothetical protein